MMRVWTGDWWWTTQVSGHYFFKLNLCITPDKTSTRATIAPVILHLIRRSFHNLEAIASLAVYLTIGNISKIFVVSHLHTELSCIGYLASCEACGFPGFNSLKCGNTDFYQSLQCVHFCNLWLKQGKRGVEMTCADGYVRRVFPILAALLPTIPEQCLIACCQENFCPRCTVSPRDRGEQKYSPLRTEPSVRSTLYQKQSGETR